MNPDMKRLKLLAAVAVLGVFACEEATPPPPVGSIVGQVAIEGTGIDGVSVNLSNGNSTTTSGGGSYRFDNVEGGAYTVTISGYPSDATFDATSAAATISSAGQSVTVNFTGAYIRTASVMGSVTVENQGLRGVTVSLSGVSSATAVTDDSGQYAFTGLRMGSYSVEISGFDTDEVGFSSTSAAVSVGVGESQIVSFDGTYLRTAGIQGRVSVEGDGLANVTVSLSGGPDAVSVSTTTDAGGQYSFAKLRAGDYAVAISGYSTRDYEFEVTSQNVTVALGETANVPFEGMLLRTAGISGRVSVGDEGMALEGVTATLSGGDLEADMTAETDEAGQYAFSGLAAGDYTVAISGYDADAYVFETTSKDVKVADDEAAIVHFQGAHATTASISGMLFVDEATKNNAYDEGETPFAAAGVPVTLVGPGVHDVNTGLTNEMGQFTFANLRAGAYQLVVQIPEAIAALMPDYAYGGPSEGYSIALAVGQAATQNVPMDITHQTVAFTAMLKHGDDMGAALPGATVTLYRDMKGEFKIDDETTGDGGMASIRFARSGTTGNMVYASVTAPSDDYASDGEMQAVTWDPSLPMVPATNDGDIVNVSVDVTVSGATKMTDAGGGEALKGWAISVMTGAGDDMAAVEGAPEALDDDGMASYTATLAADDLPTTYTFSVGDNQDNKLDGGEKYGANDVEHTHDGLSLAGNVDAGELTVAYTTQTLKVYVHHEKDQVFGYTGNILGGDARASGKVEVSIRYIDGSGRSRTFAAADSVGMSDKNGVVTFTNVPADSDVIVQAKDTADNVMLLTDGGHSDELAAYRNLDDNGVMGGAFGDMGGVSHTVSLCPLMKTDPTRQDHGECSSFAFVDTWAVTGNVTKVVVAKSGEGFAAAKTSGAPDTKVTVEPVDGKNLGGKGKSYTAAEKDVSKTKTIDERTHFDHGRMAAGVYAVGVPAGWEASTGKELNLMADTDIVVTPTTGTVYGTVTNSGDNFPAEGVTVTINGEEDTTDKQGRYLITGIPSVRGKVFVSASKDGFNNLKSDSTSVSFLKNAPQPFNFSVTGATKTAKVNGTVKTAEGTPVAGVSITANGKAPLNAATSGANKGKLVTNDAGEFSALVQAVEAGQTVAMGASKKGYSFTPATIPVSATEGTETSGIAFTGYMFAAVSGTVQAPGGGPLSDVVVEALKIVTTGATTDTTVADTDTTSSTGYFSLAVAFGDYTIVPTKKNHIFALPKGRTSWLVPVGPGSSVDFGRIVATSFVARGLTAKRLLGVGEGATARSDVYNGNVAVTWASDTAPTGTTYTYVVQTNTDNPETESSWNSYTGEGAGTSPDTVGLNTTEGDDSVHVRIISTTDNGTADGADDVADTSAVVLVAPVDPSASDVKAVRTAQTPRAGEDGDRTDSLIVTWSAKTTPRNEQRVVVQVTTANATAWVVAATNSVIGDNGRAWRYGIPNAAASGDDPTPVQWSVRSDSGVGNVLQGINRAVLLKALKVRIESRSGSSGDWTVVENEVSVDAKPAS